MINQNNKRTVRKMESNDIAEIPDRVETSESGRILKALNIDERTRR